MLRLHSNITILQFAAVSCMKCKSHWHTHTHVRLMALFLKLPRWASTRKVKPIWILLKQETVSSSGISWDICKSAPRSRQITTPAPHHSVACVCLLSKMEMQCRNHTQQHRHTHCICSYVTSLLKFITTNYNSNSMCTTNTAACWH